MAISPLTTQFAGEIAPDMKVRGFKKSGASWHRDLDAMIQVVNIQKSQWGDQFYINVGIYLKDLGVETRPTEYRCHVRCRAERLLDPDDFSELRRTLDFDEPIPVAERYNELRRLISKSALAWLEKNSTKISLANTLASESAKGFFIMTGVRECLDLAPVA